MTRIDTASFALLLFNALFSMFAKKPEKIVTRALQALQQFSKESEDGHAKTIPEISKNFASMNEILYKIKDGGEGSSRALQLIAEISHSDILAEGITSFISLPTEQRKQFTIIFTGSLSHQVGADYPVAVWIQRHANILDTILAFYDKPELASLTGEMLRVCAHHECLAHLLFQPERLEKLSTYFAVPDFDVSADSFATFRELLMESQRAEQFIRENSEMIITRLHATLNESNYASCLQSLKLIGEMIIKYQVFQDVYLAEADNLKKMMNLMLSSYKNIALEAFNVFKLFVAREDKSAGVKSILQANAEKLILFIPKLLEGIEDDDLQEEKNFLLTELGILHVQQ